MEFGLKFWPTMHHGKRQLDIFTWNHFTLSPWIDARRWDLARTLVQTDGGYFSSYKLGIFQTHVKDATYNHISVFFGLWMKLLDISHPCRTSLSFRRTWMYLIRAVYIINKVSLKTSDVLAICWSRSPSLGVTATSALTTTGTTVAFTSQHFSELPRYFSSFLCSSFWCCCRSTGCLVG